MDPGFIAKPHSRFSPSHTNPLSALYRVDLFPTPSHSYFLPNQMDQSPRYTSGTTCIPSLFPPGVDPNTVDFRTFFPYIPNEVKHRKRTSRTQLKVLEDIFRKDTKPNAALRKKLAAELDMLPRAVQVRSILFDVNSSRPHFLISRATKRCGFRIGMSRYSSHFFLSFISFLLSLS
jgi:hypothetical protein